MKRILAIVVCFVAACGGGSEDGGLCQRYADMHLSDKIGKCDLKLVGLPTRSACDSAMNSCNDDDKRQLSTLLDCLGRVGSCQSGQEDSWAGQVNSCFNRLDLSAKCNFE